MGCSLRAPTIDEYSRQYLEGIGGSKFPFSSMTKEGQNGQKNYFLLFFLSVIEGTAKLKLKIKFSKPRKIGSFDFSFRTVRFR
jgi:hypothetical protein